MMMLSHVVLGLYVILVFVPFTTDHRLVDVFGEVIILRGLWSLRWWPRGWYSSRAPIDRFLWLFNSFCKQKSRERFKIQTAFYELVDQTLKRGNEISWHHLPFLQKTFKINAAGTKSKFNLPKHSKVILTNSFHPWWHYMQWINLMSCSVYIAPIYRLFYPTTAII